MCGLNGLEKGRAELHQTRQLVIVGDRDRDFRHPPHTLMAAARDAPWTRCQQQMPDQPLLCRSSATVDPCLRLRV